MMRRGARPKRAVCMRHVERVAIWAESSVYSPLRARCRRACWRRDSCSPGAMADDEDRFAQLADLLQTVHAQRKASCVSHGSAHLSLSLSLSLALSLCGWGGWPPCAADIRMYVHTLFFMTASERRKCSKRIDRRKFLDEVEVFYGADGSHASLTFVKVDGRLLHTSEGTLSPPPRARRMPSTYTHTGPRAQLVLRPCARGAHVDTKDHAHAR